VIKVYTDRRQNN